MHKPRNAYWRWLTGALVTLLALAALAGCVLPGLNTPGNESAEATPNPAYTAAAATIIAQLTQVAEPAGALATEAPAEALAPTESLVPTQPELPTSEAANTPEPPAAASPAASTANPDDEVILELATPTKTIPDPNAGPIESIVPTVFDETQTTATPTPTAAGVEDPAAGLGAPTWEDPFDNGANWPLYSDANTQMQIANGQLSMTALVPGIWNGWMLSNPEMTNFYLEMSATPQANCGGLDRFGLVARAPNVNTSYLFGVSCDGRYTFLLWNGVDYVPLIGWTASEFIPQGGGQSLQLGIWAEGSLYRLYVNGHLLTEFTDATSPQGTLGVFVGAGNTPGFNVQVDRIAYWNIP